MSRRFRDAAAESKTVRGDVGIMGDRGEGRVVVVDVEENDVFVEGVWEEKIEERELRGVGGTWVVLLEDPDVPRYGYEGGTSNGADGGEDENRVEVVGLERGGVGRG